MTFQFNPDDYEEISKKEFTNLPLDDGVYIKDYYTDGEQFFKKKKKPVDKTFCLENYIEVGKYIPKQELECKHYIDAIKVKEFIRLLKQDLHKTCCDGSFISFTENAFKRDILEVIDKRAGEKLTQ